MKSVGVETVRRNRPDEPAWGFNHEINFNGARMHAMAATTGCVAEGNKRKARAKICLCATGKGFWTYSLDTQNGFLLEAFGNDALEALKEAVRHLYQVIVREKVDIQEIEEFINCDEDEGGQDDE